MGFPHKVGLRQSQGTWLSHIFFSSPDGVRKENGSCQKVDGMWLEQNVSRLCFPQRSHHSSAGWQVSSVQPGPEPKILFDWMTCCLSNNLLFQGGYKAVRKWLSSWEEHSNWGNHNHYFAIFAAAQHYHQWCPHIGTVMKEHLHCLSPYPNSACIQLWVIAGSLRICLTSLTVTQLILT